MRKGLDLIAIVVLASIAQFESVTAQGICLDYNTFLNRKASLDSTYVSARDLFNPNYRNRKLGMLYFEEMTLEERIYNYSSNEFRDAINRHLLTNGVLFDKIDRVVVQMYFNTNGMVDYATFDLMDGGLTGFQRQAIGGSLGEWLVKYQSRLSGKGPYRVYTQWSIKDATNARRLSEAISGNKKERNGYYAITTLEGLNTTRPDTVEAVRLERQELFEVPEILRKFKNLKALNLSANELTNVPRFVFKRLRKLTELNLTGNRITDSSLRIRGNRHLKIFNLQYNQITELPKQLRRNRRLESLWVGHNDLSAGLNPKVLRHLKRLKDLNLYDAKLATLPSEIGKLKRLEVLDVYYNQLTELPPEIGNNLALQKLAISYNKLDKLPAAIGNLKNLNTIYAHDNLLNSLPESFVKLRSLEILDISNNDFHELPNAIPFLTASSLRELNISYNKFRSLPDVLFKINQLNALSINNNPVSDSTNIQEFLPLIKSLEARNVKVYY